MDKEGEREREHKKGATSSGATERLSPTGHEVANVHTVDCLEKRPHGREVLAVSSWQPVGGQGPQSCRTRTGIVPTTRMSLKQTFLNLQMRTHPGQHLYWSLVRMSRGPS